MSAVERFFGVNWFQNIDEQGYEIGDFEVLEEVEREVDVGENFDR